jgi:hypothetical protein
VPASSADSHGPRFWLLTFGAKIARIFVTGGIAPRRILRARLPDPRAQGLRESAAVEDRNRDVARDRARQFSPKISGGKIVGNDAALGAPGRGGFDAGEVGFFGSISAAEKGSCGERRAS